MTAEYNGYVLVQEEEINHHFSIFEKESGRFCMHASYEGDVMTQEEAVQQIKYYVDTAKILFSDI